MSLDRRAFLGAAALVAVAVEGASRARAGERALEPATARFLALGDSYTIGEGVAAAERWPVQLAARLRAAGAAIESPEIIARTGWTTDELAAAIDQAAPRGPYRLVTLLIGVNNQYRGRDLENYRREFRGLLERAIGFAAGHAGRVVVLSIPDWGVTPFAARQKRSGIGDAIDRYNAVNREETAAASARYADVTPISRRTGGDAGMLIDDGLHPSPAMYREWVEIVLPEARKALVAPRPPQAPS